MTKQENTGLKAPDDSCTVEGTRLCACDILSVREMYAADAAAMEFGVSGPALMERAGRAVAEAALALYRREGLHESPVLVLAGPGNNGGDGFVAARILADEHRLPVTVALLGPRQRLKGDAARAAAQWTGPLASLDSLAKERERLYAYPLVIDALFGAGLDRPLKDPVARIVRFLNELHEQGRVRILAVDVPSGLHGDLARPLPESLCLKADITVTFFRKKPAHVLYPGKDLCGKVIVADIGIPEHVLAGRFHTTKESHPCLWQNQLPGFSRAQHKYERGSVVVLSGDALHTGASRLAAYGALHAGAGAVTLAGEPEALKIQAAHVTEIMLDPFTRPDEFPDVLKRKRAHAALLGPAAGTDQRLKGIILETLKAPALACVLDADVFTVFRNNPQDLFSAIAERNAPVVLTPHEGEFARLFPDLAVNACDLNKIERARTAARRAAATVVLKGPDTVIATPSGDAFVAAHAPPWLARAGSGDSLAGLIAGLLAQGCHGPVAACAAVHAHAEAAWRLGPHMIAADLPAAAGRILAELSGQEQVWRVRG